MDNHDQAMTDADLEFHRKVSVSRRAFEKFESEHGGTSRHSEYMNYWLTAEELVKDGYRADALAKLFGPPTPLPDGRLVWSVATVDHIENTVLAPALELVLDAFTSTDSAVELRDRLRYNEGEEFTFPLNDAGKGLLETLETTLTEDAARS